LYSEKKEKLLAHYDVIVLNPNDNFVDLMTEKEWKVLLTQNVESSSRKMVQAESFFSLQQSLQCIPKRCSNTPEEHMTEGKDVVFIVHGYGGLVFMDLLVRRKWEVMSKVYAVALIDSEHHVGHQLGSDVQLLAWIKHHCREWVTSPKPLDKPAATVLKKEFPMVSAGTEKHNLAPSSSLQSIFKYFRKALKAKEAINFSRVPIVTRSSTKRKQSA
uniref:Arb2 domain-containing protein n=1 Tax=Catagonus wagneri TaxID=51154 RepID=A0A8C3WIF0_9CETA